MRKREVKEDRFVLEKKVKENEQGQGFKRILFHQRLTIIKYLKGKEKDKRKEKFKKKIVLSMVVLNVKLSTFLLNFIFIHSLF